MRRRKDMKKIVTLIILVLALSSCEKLLMPVGKKHSYSQVYEDIWETLDKGYANFNVKNLPWGDSLRAAYQFKLYDSMTDGQFFDTCVKFLAQFQDESISLNAGFSQYRYRANIKEAPNFNKSLIHRKYLADAKRIGPFWYTVIDSVAYIYYESFDQDVHPEHIETLVEQFIDTGFTPYGVILDIRDNDGTKPANMFPIFERMGYDTNYRTNTLVYKTLYKNGPGHEHFTDYQGTFIEQSVDAKFPENMVVLTNKGTRNVGNIFAFGCAAFSNVRVMGDTTGGGTGYYTARELPNGWILEYPSIRIYTQDNETTYFGLPPHDLVDMKKTDEDNDVDTIIEAALNRIKLFR